MELRNQFQGILNKWECCKKEKFKAHPIRNDFKYLEINITDVLRNIKGCENYKVISSIGKGAWANVPWLSNLDITDTTQSGIYPVYLFCSDGSGFYLSIQQGCVALYEEYKSRFAYEAEIRRTAFLDKYPKLKDWGNIQIDLKAQTSLSKRYEIVNISAKYYPAKSIPDDKVIKQDLKELLSICGYLKH